MLGGAIASKPAQPLALDSLVQAPTDGQRAMTLEEFAETQQNGSGSLSEVSSQSSSDIAKRLRRIYPRHVGDRPSYSAAKDYLCRVALPFACDKRLSGADH